MEIPDEVKKIQEIIRAWAEVNGVKELKYIADENSLQDIFRNSISFNRVLDLKDGEQYNIAELNEKWEDAEDENVLSKDPLIKDEKIRKAVRAWAEADDLDNFRVQNQHFNDCKIIGYTAGINKASFIGFQTTIAHADNKKLYTIAELCGEEEK